MSGEERINNLHAPIPILEKVAESIAVLEKGALCSESRKCLAKAQSAVNHAIDMLIEASGEEDHLVH